MGLPDIVYYANSKRVGKRVEKTMPRTQYTHVDLLQDFIELSPTAMIGPRYIENDSLAPNFPFSARRCVRGG